MKSSGALVFAPVIGLAVICPALYASGQLFLLGTWAMIVVAIVVTLILGLPAHSLLQERTGGGYWQYGLLGAVSGALVGSLLGWSWVLVCSSWGLATTLIFRWLVRAEVGCQDT